MCPALEGDILIKITIHDSEDWALLQEVVLDTLEMLTFVRRQVIDEEEDNEGGG